MKAFIDEDTCIGCGLCPDLCPEVFKMQDDKAVVFTTPVPDNLQEKCRDAADQCPVSAILLE